MALATKAVTERSGEQRRAILSAAKELITAYGFEGTSLDRVCEVAACSKSAIYEHFGNKRGLLAALSEDVALELSQALHAFHLDGLPLDEALFRYAKLAVERVLSESHIAIVRATISAVWKHPNLGTAYYEVGAGAGRLALARFLADQVQAGRLVEGDAEVRAREFQGLLFWDRMLQQLVGVATSPSDDEIALHARQTVELFLRRYAAAHSNDAKESANA